MSDLKRTLANNTSILLVEDDADLGECLRDEMIGHFSKVQIAKTGEEALQYLRHRHFDAVVSDINMPVMTGLELLEQITLHFHTVPVILITGNVDRSLITKALALGAFDYLEKPFATELLLNRLRNAILQSLLFELLKTGFGKDIARAKMASFASGDKDKQVRLLAAYSAILKLRGGLKKAN
jgi:DNA-binding response OmpR family regulator